jgi:hypothetical protein
MSKKSIRSKRAARKRRKRRLSLVLVLGGVALVGGAVVLAVSGSANKREAAEYDPQDVVYDEPMHGIHEMGPSTVPIEYLPQDGPQPRIDVPQTFQNLGRVPASSDPQYTFVVRNEGEAPLTISRIYTTCGCTVADLTSSVIPPGKVALLTVTLDADFHPEAIGTTVRRGVIIESNDPRPRASEAWIEAYISPS